MFVSYIINISINIHVFIVNIVHESVLLKIIKQQKATL